MTGHAAVGFTPDPRRVGVWTVRHLPLRWKILLPFAALALVYGAAGTYVSSRSTALAVHGALSLRLREVAALVTDEMKSRQVELSGQATVAAFTEGLADAVARRDRRTISRLFLPLAVHWDHALSAVLDPGGAALLELRSGQATEPTGRVWSASPAVREALSAGPEVVGGAHLLELYGAWYLALAQPVVGGGAVVLADRLDAVLARLGTLTPATIAVRDVDGRLLAGRDFPTPPPGLLAIQYQARLAGESVGALSVPLRLGGDHAGVVAMALPRVEGIGALRSAAWMLLALAVGSLVSVAVLGLWVSSRISRPIGALVASTRSLARGELGHRVPTRDLDEVGMLAMAFNEMAGQLEASLQGLEQRVDERTSQLSSTLEQLNDANAELRKVSSAKSGFLASMSHELRAPLSGILLASELLQDAAYGSVEEGHSRELGAMIHQNGVHLLALIDDLLDLSRIEAGRVELQPRRIAVDTLLAELEAALRSVAEKRGVSLTIAPAVHANVVADQRRIHQILLNLVVNAVKFTEPGGQVWVESSTSKDAVAISVRDNGIGIERRNLKRIFLPFERVVGGQSGAGLGLSISRHIAELHHGRLEVSSTPKVGSTFTLILPAEHDRKPHTRHGRVGTLPSRPIPAMSGVAGRHGRRG